MTWLPTISRGASLLSRIIKYCCLLGLMNVSICAVWAADYEYELLNENDGFSSSIIFSIIQDKDGFLWFGSGYNGVMRYDGKNVVVFKNNPAETNSLPNDNAGNLFLDSQGTLWIGSWGGSVIKLDANTHLFSQYKHSPEAKNSISSNRVQSIFEDKDNVLWFGTADGGLNIFDNASQEFVRLPVKDNKKKGISDARVWGIEQIQPNELWIATGFGLNLLDKDTQRFTNFVPKPDNIRSDINQIRTLVKTPKGNLYLGTQNGVVFFDTQHRVFRPLAMPDVPNIGPIYSMLETNFGEYWVSSSKGVFSFSDTDSTLRKVTLGFDDRCSQSLFQDEQGTIWLSCEGVGVYKITRTTIFKSFEDQKVKNSFVLKAANDGSIIVGTSQLGLYKWVPETKALTQLGNKDGDITARGIRFVTLTSKGDIWYANKNELFVVDSSGRQRQIFPPKTLRSNFENINDIETDDQDNIWVTANGGLFTVNSENFSFSHIPASDFIPEDQLGKVLLGVYLAPDNTMWIAGNNTLYRLNKTQDKVIEASSPSNQYGTSNKYSYIHKVYIDRQSRLWIGTSTGLYLVDADTGERTLYSDYFLEENNRAIWFIHEDKKGFLWLVTQVGMSRFNPVNGELEHFYSQEGLPGSRMFYTPTVRPSDGTIYMSSRNGISYFNPTDVSDRILTNTTLLTNFEVLGSSINYNVAQIASAGIDLDYDQTNIKFEFATLDLLNARQIQYSYFLEGFDNDWIENSNNNSATYTNLSGGDYVFRVRAKVKDKRWYTKELFVDVKIGTPFWQQWWMFVVYVALVMFSVYRYMQSQKKAVIELELQVATKTADIAQESKKLTAANRIKSQFLANMSHEIRTPLTTIIGQAEAIICRDIKPEDIYREIEVVHDSSLYLLALLDDILDLTKIEENKFALELAPQNLHNILSTINTMFSMQAKVKALSFYLIEDLPTPFIVNIDALRFKQILINLLSNALKFTNEGFVSLEIVLEDDKLIFNVEDSGIGISHAQIAQIFNSFTQGDSSIRRRFGGSGLGLYLSNELAMLMQGSITVKSALNKGSIFTFSIPVLSMSAEHEKSQLTFDFDSSPSTPLFDGTILLAEDHEANRRLITRLLTKLGLTVYAANDGYEAIEMYKAHDPEIVLMDIQMPKMDGLAAYKTLRELGYQKPIIALTANAMKNDVEKYLSLGFDGYIQKPINREILISTIATVFNAKSDDSISRANSVLDNIDMSDLVTDFKNSLVEELVQFKIESENRDTQALQDLAHRLAGAAYLFGFPGLSEKATNLENNLKQGKQDFNNIKADLDALVTEIKQIISN
jgi:signal transduction histidine kinase/CheY-like chemotaxis protein/streptogramin lyase/HPt (histidine-containing phosphotransfer) domain-containing protein